MMTCVQNGTTTYAVATPTNNNPLDPNAGGPGGALLAPLPSTLDPALDYYYALSYVMTFEFLFVVDLTFTAVALSCSISPKRLITLSTSWCISIQQPSMGPHIAFCGCLQSFPSKTVHWISLGLLI